jgi:glycosyltransferase involved in cell wall biosynthesis
LRAADLAVLPSHEEGFSNALIEKMSAALPIITTNVGGNPEALDHGKAGRLVPPHDPAALASAIASLIKDRPGALAMGQRALLRARSLYALQPCVDCYEAVYQNLAAPQKRVHTVR